MQKLWHSALWLSLLWWPLQHSDHTTGAYKAGLLKAFERTVKEARYAMVMVDAPNVAADDLRAYWSAGQVPPY